jgi:hypothetical protein
MSINYDPSIGCDDEHLAAQSGELYDALIAGFKTWGKSGWEWDQIDFCWTGEYAYLERGIGRVGLHIESIDDSFVLATVHASKSIAGTEVDLNTPLDADDSELSKARNVYLENAQEIVIGSHVSGHEFGGEWDGDSWYLTDAVTIKIPTLTGKLRKQPMIKALIKAAYASLKVWTEQMELVDDMVFLRLAVSEDVLELSVFIQL